MPALFGLSLDLVNVDRHANGEYICTASNGVGEPANASIIVEIQCKILYFVAVHFCIVLCFPINMKIRRG